MNGREKCVTFFLCRPGRLKLWYTSIPIHEWMNDENRLKIVFLYYLNSPFPGHRDRLGIGRKFARIQCTSRDGKRENDTLRDPVNRWTCRIHGMDTRREPRRAGRANIVVHHLGSCCTSSPVCLVLRNKLITPQRHPVTNIKGIKRKKKKEKQKLVIKINAVELSLLDRLRYSYIYNKVVEID